MCALHERGQPVNRQILLVSGVVSRKFLLNFTDNGEEDGLAIIVPCRPNAEIYLIGVSISPVGKLCAKDGVNGGLLNMLEKVVEPIH